MIRRLFDNAIYLTFDDGLDEAGTPAVLDVLKKHSVQATFFLVADKVAGREHLLQRLLAEGHSIGNHSLDHRYGIYFSGESKVRDWIERSTREFESFGVRERLVGFRPPAGVVTPPLKRVLRDMGEPLILWNERFYDSVFSWTVSKARKSAARISGGSIVLLHDSRRKKSVSGFCETLDIYVSDLKARGFTLRALSRSELF